jgi:hypothetical protein
MRSFHKAASLAADLANLGRELRSFIDPYRPELHYMRGPGPKWRAKHAVAVPSMAGRARSAGDDMSKKGASNAMRFAHARWRTAT